MGMADNKTKPVPPDSQSSFAGAILKQILDAKKAMEDCAKEKGAVAEASEATDHVDDFQPSIKEHPYTDDDAKNTDDDAPKEDYAVPLGQGQSAKRVPMSEVTRAVMYGRKSIITGGSRYRAQLCRMAELRTLQNWTTFLIWADKLRVKLRAGAGRPPRIIVSEFGIIVGSMIGKDSFEVWADPEEKLMCSCGLAEKMAKSESDDLINYQFGMCIHMAAVEFKELWRIPVYTDDQRRIMGEEFPPERLE